MAGADLTLAEAAELLGVHYMTAYRYVRTGRLPGHKVGAEWRVRADDVTRHLSAAAATAAAAAATAKKEKRARATQAGATGPDRARPDGPRASNGDAAAGGGSDHGAHPAPRHRRTDWAERVEMRLVAGDQAGAWSSMEGAMVAGMDPAAIYLEVLGPALVAIGERWASGSISEADEHRATAVAHRLIGRMGPRFARRGRKRGPVLLAALEGEDHSLPVALLGDLLRGRGFAVIDLGSGVPLKALLQTVSDTDSLLAVGLSMTTSGNEDATAAAIAALHEATTAPVIVGGRAVAGTDAARALGADAGGLGSRATLDWFESLGRASG